METKLPKESKARNVEPPSRAHIKAHAEIAVKLSRMFGGMARELAQGEASPDRERDACEAIAAAYGAILGMNATRIRRVAIVRAIALTVQLKHSAPVEAVRIAASWALTTEPSADVIMHAVEAWKRDGEPRQSGKAPLVWEALARLVEEAGLGRPKPSSLRVDWQHWKKISRDV